MGDWSVLPSDILGEIAMKLDCIEDLINFSAVCHSWYDVAHSIKSNWSCPPWLLLAEPELLLAQPEPNPNPNTNPGNNDCRKIFSIGKNKCYRMMLSEINEKRCWGSSYGWIVMHDFEKNVNLFNPITKAQLSLPSLYQLPTYTDTPNPNPNPNPVPYEEDESSEEEEYEDEEDIDMMELYDWAMQILVRRFFTFKILGTEELIVFVIHYPFESLAFARPGDKAWTEVVEPWPKGRYRPWIHTVMLRDGKVVILYSHTSLDPITRYGDGSLGRIAYCDISSLINSNYNPVQAKDYNIIIPRNLVLTETRLSMFQIINEGDMYLAELAGDQLVILRIRECGLVDDDDDTVETTFRWDNKDCYRTVDFKVYKYAPNSTKMWEKVEDLGDFLLFVGDNYVTSINISKPPNCQKNAIYFIDDETKNYWSIIYATEVRGHDMGMFDMTSGEITPFYQGCDIISKYFSPIWSMPKF